MQICVLGPLEIRTASGELRVPHGARQRLLLALLVHHAPRYVASSRLIDIIWGEALPADPRAALRTQVSRLRAFLVGAGWPDCVRRGEGSSYALLLPAGATDAAVFEELHGRARSAGTAGEALGLLDEAIALWRGEPYGEFCDVPDFAGDVSRLRELAAGVAEHRVECLLELGRTPEALAAVESLLHGDPLRERSRALAMHAFYRAGRPGDALATYQDYRRRLSAELGIQPSPALRALEGQILRHGAAPGTLASSTRREAARAVARDELGQVTGRQQQIRFARSPDGVRLAYATVGGGPPLVKAANWLNHLEFDWESPVWRRLFREFAARGTFIRYDERGTGLSDRDVTDLSLEAWVMDLETVVDACGLERFPLLGISQGCAVCIEYAARHPERVSGLILHGGYAAGWRADPGFGPAEIARREASIEIVRHGWGEDTPAYRQMFTLTFIPGGTPAEIQWFNELQRRTVSPENAARFMEAFASIDVRHRLRDVKAPTLVLHSRGDQRIPYEKGRELAMGIPSARFVLVESSNHLILEHEPAFDAWMGEALRFLAEVAPPAVATAP